MSIFWNAIGAIILGALGWVALEFVGRPVRRFFDLRQRAKALMLECKDAPDFITYDIIASKSVTDGKASLKKVANEMIALGQSEFLASYFIELLGFDAVTAGTRLATLASELGTAEEDRTENYKVVDQALRF